MATAPTAQLMEWPQQFSDHESRVRRTRETGGLSLGWRGVFTTASRQTQLHLTTPIEQMVFKSIEPLAGHFGFGDRINASELEANVKREAAVLLALTEAQRLKMRDPMSRVRFASPQSSDGSLMSHAGRADEEGHRAG